jgi:hypothetical protein
MGHVRGACLSCAALVLLVGATAALAQQQQQQDETFTIHYDPGSRDQVNFQPGQL